MIEVASGIALVGILIGLHSLAMRLRLPYGKYSVAFLSEVFVGCVFSAVVVLMLDERGLLFYIYCTLAGVEAIAALIWSVSRDLRPPSGMHGH